MNQAQREAILTTEGPLLVLAGAGAGKTRVIAHRVLQIINRGCKPEQVLAITFTNKAAFEMRSRISKLLAEDRGVRGGAYEVSAPPFVSTFHSLGLTIIKEHARLLGYKRAPSIYDRADSLRAIKEALKKTDTQNIEPRAALGYISRQKSDGITAEDFAATAENPHERSISVIWLLYEQTLRQSTALDFDDLIGVAVRLLVDNQEVRLSYQRRWRYIHVDEYQDTNSTQAQLTELLVGPQQNICAVGDIDQTIYGWRGARIANILGFEKTYSSAKIILLEENYRSTKTIIAAANDVIAKNIFRREKILYTNNAEGEALSLYQAFDETDEATFIVRTIKELLEDGASPRQCAVLYRANFQSRAIEERFLDSEIPYQVVGTRFFERKEIKDALSYVRAALGGTMADLARIANMPPRGIGKVTLIKLLAGREKELTGAVGQKVSNLHTLLARIAKAAAELPPSKLMRFVITESGLEALLKKDTIEEGERLENLRELVSLAARYDALPPQEGLELFLESAALASDQDELKDDADAVRLMTVHASKGLEFPYIFIAGLEEGLFPYDREEDDASDKEEERRLMYVALTRAQRKIYLSYASYRTIYGSKNATIPSQFLSDISEPLITGETGEKTVYLD